MNIDKTFCRSKILAVSSVIPNKIMDLHEYSDMYGSSYIERITESTGINRVRVADIDKTSADYCYEAALKIFECTGICAEEIDGLIFLSESPDYIIPNTAAVLQHRLGIPTNTINMDLRYGCAGYVYGLFQASMLVESGYCKNVLLLAGDTMSKFTHPEDRSLRMVLGDAACATLVSAVADGKPSRYDFFVDGNGVNSLIIPAGGCRMPIKHGVTDVLEFDSEGNGRTKENLYMNGMDVMVFAIRQVPKLINNLLESLNWKTDDVDLFALHQANKIIVDRIVKTLKIDKNKVPLDMKDTGNCGFVSIPLMLCTLFPGVNNNLHKVIACGFGAGLIAAVGAFDFSETNFVKTIEV